MQTSKIDMRYEILRKVHKTEANKYFILIYLKQKTHKNFCVGIKNKSTNFLDIRKLIPISFHNNQ